MPNTSFDVEAREPLWAYAMKTGVPTSTWS